MRTFESDTVISLITAIPKIIVKFKGGKSISCLAIEYSCDVSIIEAVIRLYMSQICLKR